MRLKALIPLWLPWARKRLCLTPALEGQLGRISARQMDRRLQPQKRQLRKRIYGRTKPGTLLKHPIPLQTERWTVTRPGFTEIDLVSHSGECADGEFLHSLNLTDTHTTWVETRAVMGKGQERIRQALETMSAALLVRLRGIDSDNGSEFINDHLYRPCQAQRIQFTRGRPYKSVKLIKKTRMGSRLRRQYDAPQTPLGRVRACPEADAAKVAALARMQATLDPFVLAARIDRQLQRLYDLASHRRSGRRMDAAGPVDNAQTACPTRSLENPKSGFSTAPTRPAAFFSSRKEK